MIEPVSVVEFLSALVKLVPELGAALAVMSKAYAGARVSGAAPYHPLADELSRRMSINESRIELDAARAAASAPPPSTLPSPGLPLDVDPDDTLPPEYRP